MAWRHQPPLLPFSLLTGYVAESIQVLDSIAAYVAWSSSSGDRPPLRNSSTNEQASPSHGVCPIRALYRRATSRGWFGIGESPGGGSRTRKVPAVGCSIVASAMPMCTGWRVARRLPVDQGDTTWRNRFDQASPCRCLDRCTAIVRSSASCRTSATPTSGQRSRTAPTRSRRWRLPPPGSRACGWAPPSFRHSPARRRASPNVSPRWPMPPRVASRFGVGSSSNVIVERWNGVPFVEPYKKVRDVVRFLRDAFDRREGLEGLRHV